MRTGSGTLYEVEIQLGFLDLKQQASLDQFDLEVMFKMTNEDVDSRIIGIPRESARWLFPLLAFSEPFG